MTSLFKPNTQSPTATAALVKPTAPMPDPESAAAQEARRLELAKIMGRSGRSSTILSTEASRSNNDSYSASKLGSSA
jgi:hypothetical protein